MKKILLFILILIAAVAAVSCASSGTSENPTNNEPDNVADENNTQPAIETANDPAYE